MWHTKSGIVVFYHFLRILFHSNDSSNMPFTRWLREEKNWLFCGNDASAYRAAIVYSLIGTCKNAGIEPRAWMEDVLEQIPYYLRDGRDLTELLPRAWASRNQL